MTENQRAKQKVVLGLGKSGLAAARFLNKKGFSVAVIDTRMEPPFLNELNQSLPDLPVFLGDPDIRILSRTDEIIISPGIDPRTDFIQEAKNRGIAVISEIELFARYVAKPVIAITGTNGKSTVTRLVGLMAKEAGHIPAVGGNFGVPALDMLDDERYSHFVLELSSFQLEATESLRPIVSAILNISEDHMDRYDSVQCYIDAKQKILKNAKHVVLNADDGIVSAMHNPLVAHSLFSVSGDAKYCVTENNGERWLMANGHCLMPTADMKLVGTHNVANALAALAIGRAAGFDFEPMLHVLRRFTGLPHRMQWVSDANGVTYINDSKATNVGATIAALNGLERNVILIAGGLAKGQDFSPLTSAVQNRVSHVVLIGKDASEIKKHLPENICVSNANSMIAAVKDARSAANQGDIVLLSPACASMDMFKNFEERGRMFAEAVEMVVQS